MNKEEIIREVIDLIEERMENHEIAHESTSKNHEQLVHAIRVQEDLEIINGLQALITISKV